MKIIVELISLSEDLNFENFLDLFKKELADYKIEYEKKGVEKELPNGKKIMPKNTSLYIISNDIDYNKSISNLLGIRRNILNAVDSNAIESFINLSFFSQDMVSLEISDDVLKLLADQKLSLPISIYHNAV